MSIKSIIILSILSTFCCNVNAQDFPNINFYEIKRSGEKKINEGEFDKAIEIFGSYKILSNVQVPLLDKDIENAKQLTSIIKEANKFYAEGKYINAIENYKKYRSLFPTIRISSVDNKIEQAIKKIEENKNSQKLQQKDKIILAFEYNYQGEDAIVKADFKQAQEWYEKAIRIVGNLNNTVLVRAKKGLEESKTLTKIKAEYDVKTNIKDQLGILEKYRQESTFIIKPFENSISLLEETINNSGNVVESSIAKKDITKTIESLSKACKIGALIAFIENVPSELLNTNKDNLLYALNDLEKQKSSIKDISDSGDPEQKRKYAEDGYKTIINSAKSISLIGNNLSLCLRSDYYSYLMGRAKDLLSQRLNLINARNLAIEANSIAVNDASRRNARQLELQIINEIGCNDIIVDFKNRLTDIDLKIVNCEFKEAQKLIFETQTISENCLRAAELQKLNELKTKLSEKIAIEERLTQLNNKANNYIESLYCIGAKKLFDEISLINSCNDRSSTLYQEGLKKCEECDRKNSFNNHIKKLDDALSENDIKKAKGFLEKAEEDMNKGGSNSIKNDEIRILQQKNDNIKRTKKRLDADINKFRKLEFYASTLAMPPVIILEDASRLQTKIISSYNFGLNYRRYTYGESVFGSIVSLNYANENFNTLTPTVKNSLENFNLDFINIDGKFTLDVIPKSNSRMYVGFGMGYAYPIKVGYKNFQTNYTYTSKIFKPNDFINDKFYFTGSIGYELRRKKRGLSLEVFIKYMNPSKNEDKNTKTSLFKSNPNSSWLSSPNVDVKYITYGLGLTFHYW